MPPLSSVSHLPAPEGKEAPGKANWSRCSQCCPVGLGLPRGKLQDAWMEEGVSIPTPASLQLCNPKTGPPTSHCLLITCCTTKEGWMVDHPNLCGGLRVEESPSPNDFQGSCDYWEVRIPSSPLRNSHPGSSSSELCCAIWNAPWCAMWSGAGALPMSSSPHLGRQSPELGDAGCCQKYPVAPAPAFATASASPTPDPKEEDQVIQIPKESCTLEPEEAADSEWGLDLIQGRYPAIPLGFAHVQGTQTCTGLVRGIVNGIPLRAQLDLCSLGSLQVTVSHDPAVGEVHYEYQSQVMTWVSLQLPLFKPSKASDSPPRIQELWANMMLFLSLMSDSTAPWPQKNDKKCFDVHPEKE